MDKAMENAQGRQVGRALDQRFRKGIRIYGWGRNFICFQTTVLRSGRLGLPAQGKA
jgi:hypothetical protein